MGKLVVGFFPSDCKRFVEFIAEFLFLLSVELSFSCVSAKLTYD